MAEDVLAVFQVAACNSSCVSLRERVMGRDLALRLYNDGYHAGHHNTVEGTFSDDIHGADAEYYHGAAVSEILRERENQQEGAK